MKMLTVAIVGLEHVHSGCMYNAFSAHPDRFSIIGCADIPPIDNDVVEDIQVRMRRNMGKALAKGLPVYDDYHTLLDQRPDIVVVCCNMRSYPRIVEETLGLGLNTVIEKPMAMTYEDAVRMYRAAEKSTALFAINWPIAWFEAFAKAKELAKSGAIGRLFRVQYRSPATCGPYDRNLETLSEEDKQKLLSMFWYHHDMGGGASLDYGGYGCMLSTWIFERQPERVFGIRKNHFLPFSDVEDYVSFTLDFGECSAEVEGSWSTINSGEIPSGPLIYGSQGIIVCDRYTNLVKVYTKKSHTFTEPDAVYQCAPWDQPPYDLPLNLYDRLVFDKPLRDMITPAYNLRAMAALDAGIRSAYSGIFEKTKTLEE